MSVSPDTDVIYQEAVDLQDRFEVFEQKRFEAARWLRDRALELLSNGFLPDAPPEIRIEAIRLRANQMMEEERAELFKFLDDEHAAIEAMRIRNEGIVAAGWAEQFALNNWSRRVRTLDKPVDKPKELES